MKIDFTLWTNPDENILDTLPELSSQVTLGTNKVQIPEGTQWPAGDALVGNFIYKDGLLSGLVDTKALIANDSNITKIPYEYVNTTLEGLNGGDFIIKAGERCKTLKVSFGDSYKNSDYQTVEYDTASDNLKTFLSSASYIIDNTFYDADMNVIGAFDTNSISIPYSVNETNGGDYWNGKEISGFFSRKNTPKEIKTDFKHVTDGHMMFY